MHEMNRQRSATGTRVVTLVLALIVVFASIVGITLATHAHPNSVQSKSSTSSSTGARDAETLRSNVSLGLVLVATIKPIQASQGENISVVAQVYNTLTTAVNVNATSMTNPAFGPCQQGFATGVHVYSGNYSYVEIFNNRSQPAQLLLYDPSLAYTCPEVFTFSYSFSPQSDVAVVQPSGLKGASEPVNETSVLSGYWTGSGKNDTYKVFPPGIYTIVVYDAWGQKVVGYLQVTS